MKKLYLFEIEADEKPIYTVGEWEELPYLTNKLKEANDTVVKAYGESIDGRYIELFEKNTTN
ncbi:hypothetical protein [Bacillus massiliglaciei]|uniref:hypothetical protein n=1 Tax=Bacillus massiliglaciei TaxID=1816693 RepID=UPI000DA5F565|nr:hypothetical protein [Bacillus massiliglaciei]